MGTTIGKIVTHIVIVVLCLGLTLMMSGRLERTYYTIDGVDISRLGAQRITALMLNEKKELTSTTYVRVLGRTMVWPLNPLLLTMAFFAALIALVYAPGRFWARLRTPIARLAIAALLFAAGMVGA